MPDANGKPVSSPNASSSISKGDRVQFAADQQLDSSTDGSVRIQKQAPINPYRRPGRGFHNSGASNTRSSNTGSQISNTPASQTSHNRFAALQEPEPPVHSGEASTVATTDKSAVHFVNDQALANQLFGPGWTPVNSHSKDSPATLAASRARLLGVKIVKKGTF